LSQLDFQTTSARTYERALLLFPEIGQPIDTPEIEEFEALAAAAGCRVVARVRAPRHHADPGLLVGSGKAEELRELVLEHEAAVVLCNHRLSPIQERNLGKLLSVPVIDRTTLILDIFAQRARTHEGKLQVELAQLKHLATRLVRGWTHLERQRGGIGMRGPGETQLETDRRLLAGRIRQLRERLDRLEQHRARGRQARERGSLPLVALVGYTNAGKSTLFNALTSAEVTARDQLFATLDPTVRRIEMPRGGTLLASDTVGFIRDLPHELVAAFRATLEETLAASLVVQVVDASDGEHAEQSRVVDRVLADIGAADLPRLVVYNKIDRLDRSPRVEYGEDGVPARVWVSAASGEGLDLLLDAIGQCVGGGRIRKSVLLPAGLQKLRSRLHQIGAIRDERFEQDGSANMQLDLSRRDAHELGRMEGAAGTWIHQHLLN